MKTNIDNIYMYNIIGQKSMAVTPEDGNRVHLKIYKSLNAGLTVKLSFTMIELVTTAFLEEILKPLYFCFSSYYIDQKLLFVNFDKESEKSFKLHIQKVKNNAYILSQNLKRKYPWLNNTKEMYNMNTNCLSILLLLTSMSKNKRHSGASKTSVNDLSAKGGMDKLLQRVRLDSLKDYTIFYRAFR